jgi:Ca2+/Na+ antiporter
MPKKKLELSKKQRFHLYAFKTRQHFFYWWSRIKFFTEKIFGFSIFHIILIGFIVYILHRILNHFNINVSEDRLYNFSFATAGIIGASVAIIFSFSTFILQSTADLFSTSYLKKFVEDKKEVSFFWLLVFLTVASFLTPILFHKNILELLVAYLLIAFYLIYILYKGSRKRIDPETTITKIKDRSIKQLDKINKEFNKCANAQNKIFPNKNKDDNNFALDIQYKCNRNWHGIILENIKYLFEIGLRLLTKNEINSFNLTLKYIHDIYVKHLHLRNGYFVRIPASIWGSYTFDDEGFTSKVLEYFQSIGNRIIQEKRKENIYYLLKIYESLIRHSLDVKYADKDLNAYKENTLLNLILAYYIGFIESLLKSKENDWIWESIKSVSVVSIITLQKSDSYFICEQINKLIEKISIVCFANNQDTFLKELINIYFYQIKMAWNVYERNDIFWNNLFQELKKSLLFLSVISGRFNLATSELFINFHSWQVNTINNIFEMKDKKRQEDLLEKYIQLTERWSDFLLDYARDTGLENNQTGLPIVQSVENNLRILGGIILKSDASGLDKIYFTQFNIFSWYFQKTDKVENSHLLNLDEVLRITLQEIRANLKKEYFNIERLIESYIYLVEKHFEKADSGSGYNHPRIIEKLVYLGLILHKYGKTEPEQTIISKIEDLNKKYLELNKEYFEFRRQRKNVMGPDEFQLCKEIKELGEDLFSYGRDHFDIRYILKQEIVESEWEGFVSQITFCKDQQKKTKDIITAEQIPDENVATAESNKP